MVGSYADLQSRVTATSMKVTTNAALTANIATTENTATTQRRLVQQTVAELALYSS